MPRKPKPVLTWVVDSREQTPWKLGSPVRSEFFPDADTFVTGLSAGDYSILLDGVHLSIAIERKSLGDFFGICGYGRERFERELEKLREYEYRAIIIEASADDVLKGYERSQISGRSAMASLCCWSVKHLIPVWFAETHARGAGICKRLLEEFAVHQLRAAKEGGAWQANPNGSDSTTTSA
jgi:ERCC4-type nuclease